MTSKIVLIGGTGFQGKITQKLLKQRNFSGQVFISSRNPKNNELKIDIEQPTSFQTIIDHQITLVVMLTTDPKYSLFSFCRNHSIDFLDITQPSNTSIKKYNELIGESFNSRLIFSSGWMAGIVPSLINDTIAFKEIDQVNIKIYYSLKDKAGISASDFMAENADKEFYTFKNNQPQFVKHFQGNEPHQFNFISQPLLVHHFDTPDTSILYQLEKIPSVNAKITHGSNDLSRLLSFLQYIHAFSWLPLPLKKKMFYVNGSGDSTAFDLAISAKDQRSYKVNLTHNQGQSQLTALATVLHIEKLSQKESLSIPHGLYFAHQLYSEGEMTELLKNDSSISISSEICVR